MRRLVAQAVLWDIYLKLYILYGFKTRRHQKLVLSHGSRAAGVPEHAAHRRRAHPDALADQTRAVAGDPVQRRASRRPPPSLPASSPSGSASIVFCQVCAWDPCVHGRFRALPAHESRFCDRRVSSAHILRSSVKTRLLIHFSCSQLRLPRRRGLAEVSKLGSTECIRKATCRTC